MLDDGECYTADGGYRDVNQYADTPNGLNNADQLIKAIARARHETANSRFKRWGILEQRYRHPLSKHCLVFGAIANIMQTQIEEELPMFDVEYDE